jgi:hypothetical protein
MEFALNYKLFGNESKLKMEEEAKAALDEKYLTLTVMFGQPMLFLYTDIVKIFDYDYKIDLFLTSNETLNLSGLGYHYEDFLFQLHKLRNELMLKYMLMEETLIQAGFQGQYSLFDANDQLSQNGSCEIRFYGSAILILPQKNEPIRIPYCYISNINKQDYTLTITDEFQGKLTLTQMGQYFDSAAKALSDSLNKMNLRTQQTIKELIPEDTPITISKIASEMKDGRATPRKEIEQLSASFWGRLTKKIEDSGLIVEYGFLNSLSVKDEVCVGIKRGLLGELTGTYTWLLFPLLDPATGKFGNTVALEAFNSQESREQQIQAIDSGTEDKLNQKTAATGATYFFKTKKRETYAQKEEEDPLRELVAFLKTINRSMIEINFRREPIYLTESQLESTEYAQYRFAIAKIPSLKILRDLFIGRVIHASKDQWKVEVTSLLGFNTQNKDDNEKGIKGDQ